MYTPFPQPRYDSYEGHQFLQSPSGLSRELTDLSSIDLATEEDEEQPCTSKYGYPTREPEEEEDERWRRHLITGASVLLAVAALCACVASFGIAKARLPSPPSLPGALPPLHLPRLSLLGDGRRGLSARELVEGDELTTLAASRVQAADPQFSELEGPDRVREHVAAGFRHAASAAPKLNSVQLTLDQKDAVLHVLRDMSDNPRLHSTGLFVARTLQEGHRTAADKQGVARFVLERLQPRLPEMRQLRDEVIPATLRSGQNGVLTLDSEKLRFVETLGDRWNFELDASMPKVSTESLPPLPRRLALGMNTTTGPFVKKMRGYAQDAKGALATTNGDLTSATLGLDNAMKRTAHDTADQQQVAKSMACDAITEATNAFGTVGTSLTNMMALLAQARKTVNGTAKGGKKRMTVAKKVLGKLKDDVTKVQAQIVHDQAEFQKTLSNMQPLVSKIDNSSLILTRSSLMYVQGEVQQVQDELVSALKDFGALYHVVQGDGNLMDTVRLYASSVFYQLQGQFGISLPNVGNASIVMQKCLKDPGGMVNELQCRLTYAKMCLEIFLGGNVAIAVDLPTSSTLTPPAALPVLPAVAAAATPLAPASGTQAVVVPPTATATTTNAPASTTAKDDLITSGWKAVNGFAKGFGR